LKAGVSVQETVTIKGSKDTKMRTTMTSSVVFVVAGDGVGDDDIEWLVSVMSVDDSFGSRRPNSLRVMNHLD
jgi:hypothetical protein